MLKENREEQQVTPTLLKQQPDDSQQKPIKHCRIGFCNSHHTDDRPHCPKGKSRNEGSTKKTESQLNHLAGLLQKIANQSSVNPQAQTQPLAPTPLPSQPLSNPKGGINTVQVEMDNEEEDEAEDEEGENDWLYELLKELANSDDEEDEESEDESEEEDEDEST
ncbi:hypothetical protein PIB30_102468 [Stylosanthes scabra]|uniref:Uncharacterized protein n=1 Tax=Stylosanthes scabra TaxID=79078 RepID=A0ABU6RXJ8_9FABA|nr:hypothetical protein [Stylosanthes scabra]